jgi:hypothetical protein
MSTNSTLSGKIPNQLDQYEIRIQERLDPQWVVWFEGLTMTYSEKHETILNVQITDQAAMHGVLAKIRDLNLTLISINRKELS